MSVLFAHMLYCLLYTKKIHTSLLFASERTQPLPAKVFRTFELEADADISFPKLFDKFGGAYPAAFCSVHNKKLCKTFENLSHI